MILILNIKKCESEIRRLDTILTFCAQLKKAGFDISRDRVFDLNAPRQLEHTAYYHAQMMKQVCDHRPLLVVVVDEAQATAMADIYKDGGAHSVQVVDLVADI
ncbi:hypothetical protein [Vibrio algicola]|uniref:Uncharacterized protein n=1 Tax=Vibrio algicola TaxID=2662262 RepID=A0A5Q0TNB8_9VIBR|nr:hypothetical protein [Vibrio algicola]